MEKQENKQGGELPKMFGFLPPQPEEEPSEQEEDS